MKLALCAGLALLIASTAANAAFNPVEFFRGRTHGSGTLKVIFQSPKVIPVESEGTAEKDGVPRFDPNTGMRMFVLKKKKNENGELVDYKDYLTYDRTDGWFICIAPLENPQLAIAVVIEDIGDRFGGQTAAPVAANVILKARELGLLGEKYKPRPPAVKPPKKRK